MTFNLSLRQVHACYRLTRSYTCPHTNAPYTPDNVDDMVRLRLGEYEAALKRYAVTKEDASRAERNYGLALLAKMEFEANASSSDDRARSTNFTTAGRS